MRSAAAFLLLSLTPFHAADRPTLLADVRKFAPQVTLAPENLDSNVIAGHYTENGPELKRRVLFFLTGRELYLFPDGSYFFTDWGCSSPETIYDRGFWSYLDGYVELRSDRSLPPRNPPLDHRFAVLQYEIGEEHGYRLMGTDKEFQYFHENTEADDGDFMFLLCSQVQVEPLDAQKGKALKDELLRRAWNPAPFFR